LPGGRCSSSAGTTYQSERRRAQATGGMWFVPVESPLWPWDFDAAGTFDHPSQYAAHLIEREPGEWVILGFSDRVRGEFQGRSGPDPGAEGGEVAPAGVSRRPAEQRGLVG